MIVIREQTPKKSESQETGNFPPEIVWEMLQISEECAGLLHDTNQDQLLENIDEINELLQQLSESERIRMHIKWVEIEIARIKWQKNRRKFECRIGTKKGIIWVGVRNTLLHILAHHYGYFKPSWGVHYTNIRKILSDGGIFRDYFEWSPITWIRFSPEIQEDAENLSYVESLLIIYLWDQRLCLAMTQNNQEFVVLRDWEVYQRLPAEELHKDVVSSIRSTSPQPNNHINRELQKLGVKLVRKDGKLMLEEIEL